MKNLTKNSLVFLIVVGALVLAVPPALAVSSLDSFYEGILQKQYTKEFENSPILKWSLDERIALIDEMLAQGIELDQKNVNNVHQPDATDKAKISAIVDELIISYYGEGRDGILVLTDVIAQDEGPVELWSLERKAWYDATREIYDESYSIEIHGGAIMPGEGDISFDEAYEIAKNILMEQYRLSESDFDKMQRQGFNFYECGTFQGAISGREWGFTFWPDERPEGTYDSPYEVKLTNKGELREVVPPYYMVEDDEQA